MMQELLPEIPVVDLHCDLLGCVEYNPRELHFESPEVCCSVPQLFQGNVKLQVLALAALTLEGSTDVVQRQRLLFQELLKQYEGRIGSFEDCHPLSDQLHVMLAIENASGISEEGESLSQAFSRLESILETERVLYVSLTWNHENRFGGGNASSVGLKADGETFLEYLDGKKIAIDLSHTSDALAEDILNVIDRKSLQVVPIASHSNFRAVKDIPRNLSDAIAKEIIARGGLIGLNFVRRFVGDREKDFHEHLHYGLRLGGDRSLCLGADFYGGIEIPRSLLPEKELPVFQEALGNSSCYPAFLKGLEEGFSMDFIENLAYRNASQFIGGNNDTKKKWKKSSPELIKRFQVVMKGFDGIEMRKMFGYPCSKELLTAEGFCNQGIFFW